MACENGDILHSQRKARNPTSPQMLTAWESSAMLSSETIVWKSKGYYERGF